MVKTLDTYPLFSYEALVMLMEQGPVTASDWTPRIGCRNFIEAPGEWFPLSSPFFVSGAITEFVVRRVFEDDNMVEVLIDLDPLVPGGTLMHMDADLLALYCEAS